MSFTVSGSSFFGQSGSSVYEPRQYTISTANTVIYSNINVIVNVSTINVPLQSVYWSISNVTSNVNAYNFAGNALSGQLNMSGTMDNATNTFILSVATGHLVTTEQLFKVNILDSQNGRIVASTNNITYLAP